MSNSSAVEAPHTRHALKYSNQWFLFLPTVFNAQKNQNRMHNGVPTI
jgi:hypothetical protein